MYIKLLNKKHIYMLHDLALQEYGGTSGEYNCTDSRIESILAQQGSFFGIEKYPDVFQKAAMLLYFFAKDHCFIDGNKRVALFSMITFLDINGYVSNLNNNLIYKITYNVSMDDSKGVEIDNYINKLALYFSNHCIRK